MISHDAVLMARCGAFLLHNQLYTVERFVTIIRYDSTKWHIYSIFWDASIYYKETKIIEISAICQEMHFFFLQRKISLSCQDIKCCHILQTIFFLNKKRVLRPFWQHIAKKLRIGGYALYNRISEICNSCKCSCMASLSLSPMINNNRSTSTKICKCCKCFMLG